jgi:phenylacetate-CoA ligase
MNIYSIEQLVTLAKFTSPIYKKFYENVRIDAPLHELPILTNEALMQIVHAIRPDFVFADGNTHGLIFESSASTGKPKVTIWGRDEFETSMRLLAAHHWKHGLLKNNDRVTNLCASPYLSYRLVHSVIENFLGKCSEIPIGCDLPFAELNHVVAKYESNVLAGVNSTILGVAADLLMRGETNPRIERILAGGELLYGEQREIIRRAFPNAVMVSFMFGTTECGIVGFSRLSDSLNEFRHFVGASLVEIIDEHTQLPITTPGVVGKCVVTSLLRVAAPAIRIDTGDYVEWLDDPSGDEPRFRVLGRKFPFHHRLNGTEFSETDVWALIMGLEKRVPLTKLQLEIHEHRIEIAYSLLDPDGDTHAHIAQTIINSVFQYLPMLKQQNIEVIPREEDFSYFIENTRRKGRLILDCRSGGV